MKRRKKSYYDPGPRRHSGHRKGVEPAGLRRWRLAHRRTHDPVRRVKHTYTGPKGGSYFQGPKTRRYDPRPRAVRFARLRRYGSKGEGFFNKWAAPLGFLGAIIAGIWQGISKYEQQAPGKGAENWFNRLTGQGGLQMEASHLWNFNQKDPWNVLNYLRYKFTGINPDGTKGTSAWVLPFWASLLTFILTTIAKKTGKVGKYSRIINPINKASLGALAASTIGALVIPGSGNIEPGRPLPSAQPRTLDMTPNQNGVYQMKIEGAF